LEPTRVFISYNFKDEDDATVLSYLLRKQQTIRPFLYCEERRTDGWAKVLVDAIGNADAFVCLFGEALGETQELEVTFAFKERKRRSQAGGETRSLRVLFVVFPGGAIPEYLDLLGNFDAVRISGTSKDPCGDCAREISIRLQGAWVPDDGVPPGYLFAYEKRIIEAYAKTGLGPGGHLDTSLLEKGCPPDWPEIKKSEAPARRRLDPAIQGKIGRFRAESSAILVDARFGSVPRDASTDYEARLLTLPEAGPREFHCFPLHGRVNLSVGILVSGGIAPGINAVIDGIVKRHELYQSKFPTNAYGLTILGYREGLQGLVVTGEQIARTPLKLTSEDVDRKAEMGGSLLATSRWDAFVEGSAKHRNALRRRIVQALRGIDILYVIGGDGSMRAAHSIWTQAQVEGEQLSVVAIPKTMDNDILWVWQSFGFLSAVEKAREAVLNLHTEAKSNPRLCVLQLFGSDSGFVASHAGLASGVCDAVLIPEVGYTMEGLFDHVEKKLMERYRSGSPHGLVVMSETAIPLDAGLYVAREGDKADDKNLLVNLSRDEQEAIELFFQQDRRVHGQTPDHLRTGGLRIVSGVLQKMIKQRLESNAYWSTFRVFTSEPRHLIRSVPPSSSEVIFAERLGTLAVDNAMAGFTDFMVSQWLTEFVLVPLELVVLGRKRVPTDGIFWRSVLASTGQPEDMTSSKRKATGGGR
jgi:6-phosphofructokinase 1